MHSSRRALVTAVALTVIVTGCDGARPSSSGSTSSTPSPGWAARTSFPPAGCPLDDPAACQVIGEAATSLVAGDAEGLLRLHRPDVFDRSEVEVEIFPACAEGGVLRGHPIASAAFGIEVLSPSRYQRQLVSVVGAIDPSFEDDHGDGTMKVLGVGTCGPPDLAGRSYHLGYTAAISEAGAPPERVLGSFEVIHREGRWWIGLWFLDTLAAWEDVSGDPFTTIACGNMEPWVSA